MMCEGGWLRCLRIQRQQDWFGLLAEPSKSFDDIDFANASGRAPPALKKRFAANWYCHPTSHEVGQRSLLDKFPVRDDRRRITSLGRRQMPPRKLHAQRVGSRYSGLNHFLLSTLLTLSTYMTSQLVNTLTNSLHHQMMPPGLTRKAWAQGRVDEFVCLLQTQLAAQTLMLGLLVQNSN